MSADRNLLFGILAVQLDFVTKDALIAAMNAWLLDKGKPLGEILRVQGHLSADELQLLTALVEVHLRRHGGDPQRSLAALPSADGVRRSLAAIADPDVRASLGHVGAVGRDPRSTFDLPPGPTPRYEILRPHARGGLGEVFVAEDTELHRPVALKEIRPEHVDDPESRARFLLEAEVTGGLEHPGIVPVYGLGTYSDGRPFYAMRLVKGDNLGQAVKRFHATGAATFDSLEFRQLLRRFVDVCNAVAYAHSRGVLHRDLKPANVMLGRFGETLVVDWGLAKVTGRPTGGLPAGDGETTLRPCCGSESSATVMGRALGTPAYMSPEQAAGSLNLLGPATDIYSLGATLYEMLTGRVPFPDLDLDAVQKGEFPRPRQVRPGVPRSLQAICLKAMARLPAARYASALELAADVDRWLADEPVRAFREPWARRLRRWLDRRRVAAAAAAALVHGLIWLAIFAWIGECARMVGETMANVDVKLPWNTQLVLTYGRSLIDRPAVSFTWLAGFVLLDGFVLERLSRSSGARVFRELWSGLMVVVPCLLLCLATIASTTPYVMVVQGATRSMRDRDDAVRQERTRLDGKWKPISGERAGQPLGDREVVRTTFTFAERRFESVMETGAVSGVYSPELHWRPKLLRLSYWDRQAREWIEQTAAYEFDADRLRICLAPPGAVVDELPIGFTTNGTHCVLYMLQRVGPKAGK